jgi:hypothetical protein
MRLRLEAEGRGALYPLLTAARGQRVAGRWQIDRLVAVGRQGVVFAALDLAGGGRVAIKQAALDRVRSLALSRAAVAAGRAAIRREHEVLVACTDGALPALVALVVAPPVVPAASCALGVDETYLIEELIVGDTLTTLALGAWRALEPAELEARVARVCAQFVAFWRRLREAGWHYGDVSADNLLIEHDSGRLRVVDAASAVPAAAEVHLAGFSPAFLTPHIGERAQSGRPLPGTVATILPPLAKVAHFALTRREPWSCGLPDLDDPAWAERSPLCRDAIAKMLAVDARLDARAAVAALETWAAASVGG